MQLLVVCPSRCLGVHLDHEIQFLPAVSSIPQCCLRFWSSSQADSFGITSTTTTTRKTDKDNFQTGNNFDSSLTPYFACHECNKQPQKQGSKQYTGSNPIMKKIELLPRRDAACIMAISCPVPVSYFLEQQAKKSAS
jgi:hypothetical protein